jgi:hypothetical protein
VATFLGVRGSRGLDHALRQHTPEFFSLKTIPPASVPRGRLFEQVVVVAKEPSLHGIARKPKETTDIPGIRGICRILQTERWAVFPAFSVFDTPEYCKPSDGQYFPAFSVFDTPEWGSAWGSGPGLSRFSTSGHGQVR